MPAKTREDVEAQSTKDRLWESLDYSYGQQRQASDKSYDQAYSQADRQLLSRGMQRSSYGAQTLANINQQKIDTQNNIWKAQIADYQNRLTDLENQEWEKDFKERQFDEGVRQFDTTFNYQQGRDAVADNQWERQFAEGQRLANQSTANSYLMSILSSGQMPSDEMLAAAGISKADAELIRSYYAQQIAAANAAKAGSSSNRRGNNNNTDNNPPDNNNNGLFTWDQILSWLNTPSNTQDNKAVARKTPTSAKNSGATTRTLMLK